MHTITLRSLLTACAARPKPTEPAEGSKVQKVVFATTRPADYSLPYSTMEKNNVAFSAVDKRSNKLLTVMVGVGAVGGTGFEGAHPSTCCTLGRVVRVFPRSTECTLMRACVCGSRGHVKDNLHIVSVGRVADAE
jgi:hypothetical protein